MINNPAMMGQQSIPPNPVQPPSQVQTSASGSQMMSTGINAAMPLQARQNQNDELLSRCLVHIQRLRESLQVLLNTTKQAANMDYDDQSSSLSSSSSSTTAAAAAATTTTTMATATNPTGNLSANSNLRNNIDRKLSEMSASFDQIVIFVEQYDFKVLQTNPTLINHYNELSYEKQGTLIDEWSSNVKWSDKLTEITPWIHANSNIYRRTHYRTSNSNIRSRIDGPSTPYIERIIAQFESTPQQQPSSSKEYSITVQRLSDHLNIIEFSLFRSGLDIYLYIRQFTIEHVMVKPLNEKKQLGNNINNKSTTDYRALEIIAGHIRSAAVFYSPFGAQTDQGLQKLLVYISKYQTLHGQKCVGCQKHLLNGLQPTWRDFKTFEAYHEECLN